MTDKYVKPTKLVVTGPYKAERREQQRRKARYGMQVRGRSIKSVLLPLIGKKAKKGNDRG